LEPGDKWKLSPGAQWCPESQKFGFDWLWLAEQMLQTKGELGLFREIFLRKEREVDSEKRAKAE
jgi:hypothetical protein